MRQNGVMQRKALEGRTHSAAQQAPPLRLTLPHNLTGASRGHHIFMQSIPHIP